MENVKQSISNHIDKFKFLLFGGTIIAAINSIARPDFNIILYLYIYYVWNMMNDSKVKIIIIKETQISEKINTFFIMLFSLGIDIIWVFFWTGRYAMIKDEEKSIHSIVIFLSWIGIILKV
jgi:hypothetical protein